MKDEREKSKMDIRATIAEIERLERELGAMEAKAAAEKASESEQVTRAKNKSYRTSVLATVIFTLLIFVVFSAQTYAYFTDSVQSLENKISSGNLNVTTVAAGDMVTTEDIAIMPGTTVGSGVSVKNEGSLSSYVRVKIEKSITDLNGNAVTMPDGWEGKIVIEATDNWHLHTDEYYYYNSKVEAGAETSNLFTGVTFSTEMDNDFTNKKITLTIITEAVQSDYNGDTSADGFTPWHDSVSWKETTTP